MFRRGDLPEPPPKGYEQLGLHPAWTIRRFPTKAALSAYCRENNVSANDACVSKDFLGCAIPTLRQVGLLEPGVLNDPVREAAIEAHEAGGHSWGLQHRDGGRGWLGPDGKPAEPLTVERALMMRSMAEAQAKLREPTPQQLATDRQGGGGSARRELAASR